jgi:hypothetical protein
MKTIVIAAAIAVSGLAHAEFWDGNKLLTSMTDENATSQGLALGYIIGAADAQMGKVFCTPASNVTGGQIQDIVKNWLYANPSLRHYTADTIVGYSLSLAFPCAAKKPAAIHYD